jgi:hypothetical protein
MKGLKTAGCILLISMLSVSAFGQSKSQRELQKLYDQWSVVGATLKVDKLVTLIKSSAHSTFVFIEKDQSSFDLNNYLSQVKAQYKKIKKINSLSNKIVKVTFNGQEATCIVRSSYDMFLDQLVPSRLVGSSESKDIWVKTARGWKMKKIVTLKETATMNGKKVG